ncbi:MAG: hypothetical protein KKB70_06165 [Proteobacteria bacterium]|nr:hypothetical protein [Pseudomonadota bacterium]
MCVRLFSLLLITCTNEAQPILDVVEGRDLGPQIFARDVGDEVGDLGDAVDAPDGEDIPSQLGAPCLLLSGGCGQGLKCTLSINGHGICQMVGEQQAGASCGARGFDDCEAGLLCVDLSRPDTPEGLRCYPYCHFETGQGCDAEATCVEGPAYAVEPLGLCVIVGE